MTMSGTTVLLVHGAWHGSWCWAPVVERLDASGISSRTVDLPSVHGQDALGDLHDDAAAVRVAADAVDGPVVVVAHSYGGSPATEGLVGAGRPGGHW
jgi:pimeloyl-ACP methyl ester carboxylesterase